MTALVVICALLVLRLCGLDAIWATVNLRVRLFVKPMPTLDSEYESRALEQHHAEQLERHQMIIRQIITKMFMPE